MGGRGNIVGARASCRPGGGIALHCWTADSNDAVHQSPDFLSEDQLHETTCSVGLGLTVPAKASREILQESLINDGAPHLSPPHRTTWTHTAHSSPPSPAYHGAAPRLEMSSAAEPSAKMAAKAAAASAAAGEDAAKDNQQKKKSEEDEVEEADDEIQYKAYRPSKLEFGRDHPDPVVENASLAGEWTMVWSCRFRNSSSHEWSSRGTSRYHVSIGDAGAHHSRGEAIKPPAGGDRIRMPKTPHRSSEGVVQ